MKILSLCHKSPYPPKEGGSLAMNMIIEGLIEKGHEVKVFALQTNKYNFSKEIPEEYIIKTQFESVYIDLSLDPLLAFRCLVQNKSFHIERFKTKEIKDKLKRILQIQSFDIIHFESIFLLPYLDLVKEFSMAKIIVRTHNVEHEIWMQLSRETKNPLKRFYLSHLSDTLKNYELEMLNKVDLLACISIHDKLKFKSLGIETPIFEIPFGIDPLQYQVVESSKKRITLFFIGALNWIPNIEGLKWFLENVWMDIHEKFPQLEFYIAGRETPEWLFQSKFPNVRVIGEVESAKQFMNQHDIMIAPLLSGSGIRIKIIEAMALEKVVITTIMGAQGINYTKDQNLLIADSVQDFVKEITKCFNEPNFAQQIKKNAAILMKNEYNSSNIINNLIKCYKY